MQRNAVAEPSLRDACDQIAPLLASALQFVACERGQAMMRKWLGRRDVEHVPEDRLLAMAADAVLLSADLLLSQPAASGATAFDRLAKTRADAPATEKAAIAALRGARFRMLRLQGASHSGAVRAHDALSLEALRIAGAADMPPLPAGTVLFGRVAMLGDGLCCLPGAITPLDQAAIALAREHASAGAPGGSASARWAEAVYGHVVRHGTMDVPGLNRPAGDAAVADDGLEAEGGALFGLAMGWAALGDEAPGPDLLRHTRQHADLPTILDALAAAALSRADRADDMAAAFDRLLLVMMETVVHRERSGSGTLTIDAIGRAVDEAAARMPPGTQTLFAALRMRLVGGDAEHSADNPALERLVQRIQGLRAKTVAQGCTEQEAMAAAEKVAELLDPYDLSLGELDLHAQPCDGIGVQTDRRRFAPIDTCVPAIAAFFDCRVWVEHPKGAALRYVFFGLRSDVTAARYLYELVERAFGTETEAFRAGDLCARMAGERRGAANSFQTGLAQGISGKLHSIRATRDACRHSASGRDLVPVKAAMIEDALDKLGLDLRLRGIGRRKSVLTDAFMAGEAAGERFEPIAGITKAA